MFCHYRSYQASYITTYQGFHLYKNNTILEKKKQMKIKKKKKKWKQSCTITHNHITISTNWLSTTIPWMWYTLIHFALQLLCYLSLLLIIFFFLYFFSFRFSSIFFSLFIVHVDMVWSSIRLSMFPFKREKKKKQTQFIPAFVYDFHLKYNWNKAKKGRKKK